MNLIAKVGGSFGCRALTYSCWNNSCTCIQCCRSGKERASSFLKRNRRCPRRGWPWVIAPELAWAVFSVGSSSLSLPLDRKSVV